MDGINQQTTNQPPVMHIEKPLRSPSKLPLIMGGLLLLGLGMFGGYMIRGENKVVKKNDNEIAIISPTKEAEPISDVSDSSPTPENLLAEKIYLVIQKNKSNSIVMNAPENAKMTRKNDSGYITSTIKVNDTTYQVSAFDGGMGGPCPMNDPGSKCGYIDETLSGDRVKIDYLRIWSDEKGTFLINPQDITTNGNLINNLAIYKLEPNTIFSKEEVELWKKLLSSISTQQ